MQAMYLGVLAVHIVAALVSVATFWVAAIAKKGSSVHVRSGGLYVRAMVLMAGTALVLCAMNVADPLTMNTFETTQARRAVMGANVVLDTPAMYVTRARTNAIWLAYLAVVLLAGIRHGLQVVRTKRDHQALRRPLDVAAAGGVLALAPVLIAVGLNVGQPIITALGVIGGLNAAGWLRFMFTTAPTPNQWWLQHMGAFLGTGLSLHGAFLLAVGRHLPGPPGSWRLRPSLLVLAGIPAIFLWRRYYQRRFAARATPAPRTLAA